MPEIAIIGGGASGMMCAVSLKKLRPDLSVTVFEHNSKTLKKVLVTGNGRCNILNMNTNPSDYYEAEHFVEPALAEFTPQSNMGFFKSLGLLCMVDECKRAYPISQSAASVSCAIDNAARILSVKVKTDTDVKSVDIIGNKYITNNEIKADCIVFACGGAAAPKQGSDGSCYSILSSLGVKIKKPSPALCGITVRDMPFSLKGLRRFCNAALYSDKKMIFSETGEVQFNDYGLSGIPIMQMSRFLAEKKNCCVILDCLPETTKEEIKELLQNQKQNIPSGDVLCGLLPRALANYVLLLLGVKKDTPFCNLSDRTISEIAEKIKSLEFSANSAKGFDSAQVTRGGADTTQFNKSTMESKTLKGLYVIGETLDVDGPCGGFNLGWAWSSARLAAKAISKEF